MKKIIVIVGSARKGSSLFIGEHSKKFLEEAGIKIDLIQLSNYKIDYCDGCLICDNTGICHKHDDTLDLINKIKDSDGVIFISPTRWSLLSGDIKVFMDRWNPLAGKNIFDNKKSLIVAVGQTALKESDSIKKALESLRFFSDDAGFQCCGEYAFEECLNTDDIKKKDQQIIEYSKLLKQYANMVLNNN